MAIQRTTIPVKQKKGFESLVRLVPRIQKFLAGDRLDATEAKRLTDRLHRAERACAYPE